jgi:hypothetical protein
VPDEIALEIKRFAEAVVAPMTQPKGSITQKSVASAWGITRGRKPVAELRNRQRAWAIYLEYWELRRGSDSPNSSLRGVSHGEAMKTLVEKHNKSPKLLEGIMTEIFATEGKEDPFNGSDY